MNHTSRVNCQLEVHQLQQRGFRVAFYDPDFRLIVA